MGTSQSQSQIRIYIRHRNRHPSIDGLCKRLDKGEKPRNLERQVAGLFCAVKLTLLKSLLQWRYMRTNLQMNLNDQVFQSL